MPPLTWAVLEYEENSDFIKRLLKAGADVNARSGIGETALMDAVRGGRVRVIKQLLKAGADVNARNGIGETALMYAVRSGRVRVIKQLLKAGADVNSRDNEGKTALDYAEGREKAAAILRAAGGKRGEEI